MNFRQKIFPFQFFKISNYYKFFKTVKFQELEIFCNFRFFKQISDNKIFKEVLFLKSNTYTAKLQMRVLKIIFKIFETEKNKFQFLKNEYRQSL